MKLSFPNMLMWVVTFLMASGLNAEVVTEATIGSGYQGNLFNDSNDLWQCNTGACIIHKECILKLLSQSR